MVIFICGPDTYRSRRWLANFREKFMAKRDKSGLSTITLDGQAMTVDEFRKAIYSPSLFSEKRMVIVEKFLSENHDENLMNEILIFVKKSKKDQDNVLIFWEEDFEKNEINQKLVKLLENNEYSYQFKLLSDFEVEAWIKKEVTKRGGRIEPKAVGALAGFVGSDLWHASSEIDKLLASSEQKLISTEMVLDLVTHPLEENIWLLVDALGEKNKKQALKLLADQLALGTSVGYLVSMLARQLRIIFLIKEVLEKFHRLNYQKLAEKLKLHPYVCQKAISQAKVYKFSEIKKIYQKLTEIDLKNKTTKVDPEVLLDLLIVNL